MTKKEMLIKKIETIIAYYKKEQKETNRDMTEDLIREIEHIKHELEQGRF